MNRIVFTRHAGQSLQEREITEREVEEAIAMPDNSLVDHRRPDLTIVERVGRPGLRVIYAVHDDVITVITVHRIDSRRIRSQ